MKKQLLLGVACLLFSITLFGQADCANALTLTPGTQQCGDSTGQLGDFPADGSAPANPCNTNYNDDEYWFEYTAAVTGETLELTMSGITQSWSGFFVLDNCPTAAPSCILGQENGSSTADATATTPALTAGTSYKIVISSWGTPDNTGFCMDAVVNTPSACAISIAAGPPANCNPADNTYSQDIVVTFSDEPTTGMLDVNGQLFAIGTSPQTVTLTGLASDGADVDVTAFFVDDALCSVTTAALYTAPAACQTGSACTAAETLTPGTQQCGTYAFSGSFPDDGSAPTNPCNGSYNDEEYWFEYTAVTTGETIDFSVSGLDATYAGLYVLDDCPANGPACVASQDNGNSSADFTLSTPALTAGTTYRIALANWAAPSNSTYCLDAVVNTPTSCAITVITAGTQSACNPADNTYTQEVEVRFTDEPATGMLDVNGQLFAIGTSPQTVTLVGLDSDGLDVDVTAFFDADVLCTLSEMAAFTAPAPCQLGSGCMAAVVLTPGTQQCGDSAGFAGEFPSDGSAPTNPCNSSYNDDEYWFEYTAAVTGETVDFTMSGITETYAGLFVLDDCPANGPTCISDATNGFSSADLTLSTTPLVAGTTYRIVIANWGAPNNTAFCLDAVVNTPSACTISITAGAQTACNTVDNTYTQEVIVVFADEPGTGMLDVNGQQFAIGTSPQTVTLVGLDSDGADVDVTAFFVDDALCAVTTAALFTAPAPCQTGSACAAAEALTPGTQQCADSAGFAGDFPGDGTAPTNPCDSDFNDDEYWFEYTASTTGETLDLTMSGITQTWAGLFMLDGCPADSPSCLASADNGSSTADLTFVSPPLVAGTTYTIVISNYGTPNNTAFCLDAVVIPPPAIAEGAMNTCISGPATLVDGTVTKVDLLDAGGNLIAAISSTVNLGMVNASYVRFDPTDSDNRDYVNAAAGGDGFDLIDRSIVITPDIQPSADVSVFLYYTDAEYAEITNDADGDNQSADWNALTVTKFDSDDCSEMVNPQNMSGVIATRMGDVAVPGGWEVELLVSSFSGFQVHEGGAALPVKLNRFTAKADGRHNMIEWSTASEINVQDHTLMKSNDATNWEVLGVQDGEVNSSSNIDYEMMDVNPFSNTYYQLMTTDIDGSISYSPIVSVTRDVERSSEFLGASPVPTRDVVNLNVFSKGDDNLTITLTDISGKTIMVDTRVLSSGDHQLPLDLSDMTNGVYMVTITSDYIQQTHRVIKN